MGGKKPQYGNGQQVDYDLAAAYLAEAGFPAAAALAMQAKQDTGKVGALEEAVYKLRQRLPLPRTVAAAEAVLRLIYGSTTDLYYRTVQLGPAHSPALIVALNGMADRTTLQSGILSFLWQSGEAPAEPDGLVDWLVSQGSAVPGTKAEADLPKLVRGVLNGDSLIIVEGASRAVLLATPGWEHRAVEEPTTETVIRGPREGFTESFVTNCSLLRRRLRDPRLCIEDMEIGTATGTRVGIVYLRGVCKASLVAEARRRLGRIKTAAVIDSGIIEEFIEDTPYSPFPQTKSTERPDVVAAAVLEGRMGILVDGTPFALVVPTFLIDMMQAPDDYYERYPIITMIRFLRWVFALLALTGPSLYVALTTFHPQMLPTQLLLSMASTREGVPFPAVIEALLMEVAFEALREAGIRLPKPIGQAISIVGALVIGQASVQAGIVSPIMVIVVAITGIASFIVPKFSAAIALRMLRFPLLLLAGSFGAYGLTLGLVVIACHLTTLRSFGAPYMAPLAPLLPADLDDTLARAPHWANRDRPAGSESLEPETTAKGMRPGPHNSKGDRT